MLHYAAEVPQFTKEYVESISRVYEITEKELGSPDCGTAADIPKDFRIDLGLLIGIIVGIGSGQIPIVQNGVHELFEGMKLSNGDMIYKIACGIYRGSNAVEYTDDSYFFNGVNNAMNAGNVIHLTLVIITD